MFEGIKTLIPRFLISLQLLASALAAQRLNVWIGADSLYEQMFYVEITHVYYSSV